jgi:hypothetical protein
LRGGVHGYAAQEITPIDTARVKKDRFRMETNYDIRKRSSFLNLFLASTFDVTNGLGRPAVHTDEYEISLGREVSLCRRVCRKLEKAIRRKEEKYGMTTEALVQHLKENPSAEANKDFQKWQKEIRELSSWQQKLREYEKVFHPR